jgi:hypothetical protein
MRPAPVTIARRVGALVWLSAWTGVLVFLLRSWSELGGWVDERVRWSARLGLLGGPVIGFAAGNWARDLARWGAGRSHATLLRVFLIPPAALVALVSIAATAGGLHDETRAVLGGFAGYWAGFDAGIAVWPLVQGRPWRFHRDIPPDSTPDERCNE